jgi:CheY-like chemotaxis protein
MPLVALRKILVVENDPHVACRLTEQLTLAGFNVVLTCCGRDAIGCARYEQPAVITLELRLPDLSGLQVADCLAKDPLTIDIPIVFTAAWADQRLAESCDLVRGRFLIHKPFHSASLISLIHRLPSRDELAKSRSEPATSSGILVAATC